MNQFLQVFNSSSSSPGFYFPTEVLPNSMKLEMNFTFPKLSKLSKKTEDCVVILEVGERSYL